MKNLINVNVVANSTLTRVSFLEGNWKITIAGQRVIYWGAGDAIVGKLMWGCDESHPHH
ncbi:MAG: hypothetical protein H6555_09860 [Lewinellaceae bacterium]|nr:hypothetical protein [Lewinellaceae bacterium]